MKYDDNLFEDTPYPTTQQMDDSLFEDSNTPSELESLARGAASGLTFSLADELTGAGEALGRATFGEDQYKDLLKNYQKYRDESRKAYEAAEEANPGIYLTGDIAGSIAPAFLTGGASAAASAGRVGLKQGLGKLAAAGAKQGALAGFGASKADLVEGELEQAAKDTGTGLLVGAGAGMLIPKAASIAEDLGKSAIKSVADKSPIVFEKGKQAYDLAKKGVDVVGKKAKEATRQDALKASKELIEGFQDQYKSGSKKVGEALKSYDKNLDVSKQLGEIENNLLNSNIANDDLARLQRELNNYKEIVTSEEITSGLEKAVKELELKIEKAKAASQALGEDVSFSPVENVGNKFLQTLKTVRGGDELIGKTISINEGTGLQKANEMMQQKIASLQAQANQLGDNISISSPIFDKESNSLISTVKSLNNKGEEVVRTISQKIPKDTITNIPNFEQKMMSTVIQHDIPEDTVVKNTVESFKKMDLQELNNVKKDISRVLNKGALDRKSETIAKNLLNEIDTLTKNTLNPADYAKLQEGNLSMRKGYQAGDIFSELEPNSTSLTKESTLADKMLSGSNTKGESLDTALGLLENSNINKQAIKDLSVRNELQKNLQGEGGMLGGLINPKGAAIRIGEAAGTVANKMEPVADFTKRIVKMDDQTLLFIANKMKMNNEQAIKKFGTTLEKAIQDTTKRDRLIWALSQQPEFRRMFNSNQEEQN